MQAIILAGGLGTRLKSVVQDVPKPLAPIQGKPFLDYVLHYLVTQHITHVVLSLHHQSDAILSHYANGFPGLSVSFVIEQELLGTGGAIRFAQSKLNGKEPFFVLNGDTFLQVNYRDVFLRQQQRSAGLTMLLRSMEDCSRYGRVLIHQDRVIAFQEKGVHSAGFINAGVYLISPVYLDSFELPNVFSFERDFLFQHIQDIQPHFVISEDYFIDIGIPNDYFKANMELPNLFQESF